MYRHEFMTTEFPLRAAPQLDARPFTEVQLRAFELFVNGSRPSVAIHTAIAEHHSLRGRTRRLMRRLASTRSELGCIAMMLVIGFGPATVYNLTTR